MATLRFAVLGFFGAWAIGGSALAGPFIATNWINMTMSLDDCFKIAEESIEELGFDETEPSSYSRFGSRGDYTVAVRCEEEKRVVWFSVAGPKKDKTASYQAELQELFEERTP